MGRESGMTVPILALEQNGIKLVYSCPACVENLVCLIVLILAQIASAPRSGRIFSRVHGARE